MKYKLICSDLDDTLLNDEFVVGEGNKSAVKRYVDSGGKFVIATGRMTSGAVFIARDMGLHGELITFQGAVTSDIDTGKILDTVTIDNASAIEICKYIEAKGYYCQTYEDDFFVTQKATDYTKLYGRLSSARFVECGKKLSDYIREKKLSPPKILLMDDEGKIPEIMSDLRNVFSDGFLINTSKPFIVEIVPREINKGSAVLRLAKKYNIKSEEIICIGDSENDVPMLKIAGLSVVVANGSETAKKSADVIAPKNSEDAVAWVIKNYGLK